MDEATAQHLIELNRKFYQDFGPAFAETRRRVQNGVKQSLNHLTDRPGERWADLGCGSGAFAVEWLRAGRKSSYIGVDFSPALLEEARTAVSGVSGSERVKFLSADLTNPGWAKSFENGFAGVLAFAVLHHIPSQGIRERLLFQINSLLCPVGSFVFSVWQFHNSPRLLARVLPWETAGLQDEQLDPGDYLLDWRHLLPGQNGPVGLRYVHLFTKNELAGLAIKTGFIQREEYLTDGQDGRLGLYQFWQKMG